MEAGDLLSQAAGKAVSGMDETKIYRVMITETRQKAVSVEARSEHEARRRAEDAWRNAECILKDEDLQGVECYIIGEGEDFTDKPERIEPKDAAEDTVKGGAYGDA